MPVARVIGSVSVRHDPWTRSRRPLIEPDDEILIGRAHTGSAPAAPDLEHRLAPVPWSRVERDPLEPATCRTAPRPTGPPAMAIDPWAGCGTGRGARQVQRLRSEVLADRAVRSPVHRGRPARAHHPFFAPVAAVVALGTSHQPAVAAGRGGHRRRGRGRLPRRPAGRAAPAQGRGQIADRRALDDSGVPARQRAAVRRPGSRPNRSSSPGWWPLRARRSPGGPTR